MAGMLPGVECARRRRFHQSGGSCDSMGAPSSSCGRTRRSSFCLYTSNHETHTTSASILKRTMFSNQFYQDDEKLGVVAREAKERLDERLRTQRKSEPKRQNNSRDLGQKYSEKSEVKKEELQKEVYNGSKKSSSGSRKFGWTKLSPWRASDQEECTICLERFRPGEGLVHLPCAHRFHHGCLVPWLHNNTHCPCCRMVIITTQIS
ncbi:probable E3 ubiquitin-protein ligase RHY1A isoform X2 [Cannabis sativa]|uniref:probable E3 ubiquitin-protein ligase RHY1A isoform X2 n=1 Tax=Cannabis sativa TaxID=3483 RepID=UPI0011DF4D6B|nr:probable E3 ubiquitin-protein ligase RHY1A isoform X2 [Cannabis sativa]